MLWNNNNNNNKSNNKDLVKIFLNGVGWADFF